LAIALVGSRPAGCDLAGLSGSPPLPERLERLQQRAQPRRLQARRGHHDADRHRDAREIAPSPRCEGRGPARDDAHRGRVRAAMENAS